VLVTGMTVGTLFTLFIVPVFYSLIAAQHQPSPAHEEIAQEKLLSARRAVRPHGAPIEAS
jgi:multidrug efflux pump